MLINNFDELREHLLELRGYYNRNATAVMDEYPDDDHIPSDKLWDLAKAMGGLEAVDALYLAIYGGREMMALLEMTWEANALADQLNNDEEK